jgi:type I restriction enzyme R subunit
LEKLDIVHGMMQGFDYSAFATQALQLLPGAMNHILSLQGVSGKLDGKKRFLDVMTALSSAYTLCSTLDEVEPLKKEIAFLSAVKAAISKFTTVDKRRSDEEKNSALKQIIDNAIVADGVDDIFSLVGLDKPNIGLLSPEFMDDVSPAKTKKPGGGFVGAVAAR